MTSAMRELEPDEAQTHVDEIAELGYSVVREAFAPSFAREIVEELERLERLRPGGDLPPQPFSGFVTRRWFDVLNDGDIWQSIAIHPAILSVLSGVLGEGFLLSTMGTAVVGPGEKAQPLHVDDGVYEFPRLHPNLVCNTMWAVDEFTEENGATVVVPRSNHFDTDPVRGENHESVQLTMPVGSIAFVVGSCHHGAGENRSAADRHGLTINYCCGSMRQQENLMLSIHPARMMTFPRELQDILGFKMCRGAGHMFAGDPRLEMERHYGPGHADAAWLELRGQRTSSGARPKR